ncbi:hypothetical protein K491DRAFT_778918 [Lophiostoma macrostomum CBS 122681]|uniref:RING-type domain-containing protein n=1 Tax=Lophiostoma macrostomum CBS 122681 TaxID=1314788 RepID=A0A6A6T9H2_9PLEO|nr:hypothetical protein K491DRAFT_778918 [Lophiostoma macrostomum CBS 122681]
MPDNVETINPCGGCLTRWACAHIRPCPIQTSTQNEPSSSECSICQEPYNEHDHVAARITDISTCPSHVFGLQCIITWITSCQPNRLHCPICRGLLLRVRGHHLGEDREDENYQNEDSEDATNQEWEDVSDSDGDTSDDDSSEDHDSDNRNGEFHNLSPIVVESRYLPDSDADEDAIIVTEHPDDFGYGSGWENEAEDSDSEMEATGGDCAIYHEALAREIVSSILEEHEATR